MGRSHNIRVNVDDATFRKLSLLRREHGNLSHLIRQAINEELKRRADELDRLEDKQDG